MTDLTPEREQEIRERAAKPESSVGGCGMVENFWRRMVVDLLAALDAERARNRNLADAIQEAKHVAQMATARCAYENDWDMEAYYRAKAEGLSEAEKIARRLDAGEDTTT